MPRETDGLNGSLVIDTQQRSWVNRHFTYEQPIKTLYDVWNPVEGGPLARYNATTRKLLGLVDEAVRDGIPVRGLGSGWSFSHAPATEGRLVNTKPLNLHFRIAPRLVDSRYAGDRGGLRFVQCGSSIFELNERFRRQRRSLKTSGASNGQTIVGAQSTGTHGSALDVGAIHDFIIGMHVVVGPGRHVWLERASYPVVTDEFAAKLGGAEPVRDDALFDAALVSFGSFGFIHGVMLETDPIFLLEMYRQQRPLDDALRTAIDTLDFSGLELPGGAERPYHFQVVINPYAKDGRAHVITMYRRPYRSGYRRPKRDPDGFGPGDNAAAFIGLATDLAPDSIPVVVNQVLARAYEDIEGVTGTLGEIFTNTTLRGKLASTAMGLPVSRSTEVLDTALAINRQHGPFPVLLAFRYVPGTRATLGWTRFETSSVFELDGPQSDGTREFYRRVWQALRERDIPHTFHWGKQLPLERTEVRRMYGDAVDRWVAARETLLDAPSRRAFSNRFLEELGLAT